MSPIKFKDLVTFSSEDPNFVANNLLKVEGTKKWKCKEPGEKSLSAVLGFEKPIKIASIHIGNEGSAFVEISVARGDSQEFSVILPSSSFMSPIESRNEDNLHRVRLFGSDKLHSQISKEKWDKLKIICTQPFNKRIQYGLSFINVETITKEESTKPPEESICKLGAFKIKEEKSENVLKAGSYFAKAKKESDKSSWSMKMKSKEVLLPLAAAEKERDSRSPHSYVSSSSSQKEERKRKMDSITSLPSRDVELRPSSSKAQKMEEFTQINKTSIVPKKNNDQRKTFKKNIHFNKLFNGVIFALSGYKNPKRGEIRSKALAMGATYSEDWTSRCTHLICAFTNTPKYKQVKAIQGRIVKESWIENSHRDKTRHRWRKHCLDLQDATKTDDKGNQLWEPASEGESLSEEEEESVLNDPYSEDTEDEIEQCTDRAYDISTDEEGENDLNKTNGSLRSLPNFFSRYSFYFHSVSEHDELMRIIVACGGVVSKTMSSEVNYVISKVPYFNEKYDFKTIYPSFVRDCLKKNTLLEDSLYLVTNTK